MKSLNKLSVLSSVCLSLTIGISINLNDNGMSQVLKYIVIVLLIALNLGFTAYSGKKKHLKKIEKLLIINFKIGLIMLGDFYYILRSKLLVFLNFSTKIEKKLK